MTRRQWLATSGLALSAAAKAFPKDAAQTGKDRVLTIQRAWREHALPFHDRPPRPYPKPAEKYYEDYWFHELDARCLIIEENGGELSTTGAEYKLAPGTRPLTRRESLATVVIAEEYATRDDVLLYRTVRSAGRGQRFSLGKADSILGGWEATSILNLGRPQN